MAGPGREIRLADQRPVDAGRRHFQMIGLVDRILDVERRRHRAADLLAILDGHGAVVALGHDLQRQSVLAGQPHADEAKAHAAQHRRDDRSDARIDAALADDAVVSDCVACACRHQFSDGPGNKKERDRVDPLFVIPTKNLRLI